MTAVRAERRAGGGRGGCVASLLYATGGESLQSTVSRQCAFAPSLPGSLPLPVRQLRGACGHSRGRGGALVMTASKEKTVEQLGEHSVGARRPVTHDPLAPRLGSTQSIQAEFFAEHEVEEDDGGLLGKIKRSVAGFVSNLPFAASGSKNGPEGEGESEEKKQTLLGSSSIRVLHDELVPEEDRLERNGESQTRASLEGTLNMLSNPEEAAKETGGAVVLGSRRLGWTVQKMSENAAAAMAAITGGEGEEGDEPAKTQTLTLRPEGDGASGDGGVVDEMLMPNAEGDGMTALQRNGKNYKMETMEIDCSLPQVFTVTSELSNYPDWCGTGIKTVTERLRKGDYVEAVYKAGAFGYMFDFVLGFTMEDMKSVSFECLEGGNIKRLEGGYQFVQKGADKCRVYFEINAELAGFIPRFVQESIAKLILGIAVGELKKYAESDRCQRDLEARGVSLPPPALG
uniref:Coenzyme Q-binding protein COQ10 START domain-containing protein n=1 Tax=Hemiselmis andersenii TaxID=464988 RepID=A0A7S0Y2T0_HEMAN|mmetsp:Transcript_40557/g.94095  ORF Transcript_40557/g.94095 Transcript_40557/m.94095 type:complete len:458 (+) Transcript_40557:137-1510(+)